MDDAGAAEGEGAVPVRPPLSRFARLGIPLLLYPLYAALVFLLVPADALFYIGLMLAYIVPPVGRETLIPLAAALGYPWWITAASFAYIDITGCLLVALNFDLLLRLPYLGPWLERFCSGGHALFRRHEWIRGLSYAGLFLFVLFPFEGSGGVGGTVAGRLLGLGRRGVVLCVAVGAITGSALYSFGAGALFSQFSGDIVQTVGLLLCVLAGALVLLILRRLRRGDALSPAGTMDEEE
ncbi:small multi-drug export protein [Methanofollis fontis]|uniref:Small multi-drug export protein n=1 Tax=Methanofollis fontis TaxID=2052832 RepID=A0A483CZ75_9EURY|nr:small multi-drug export protein [Methanofollis fontis]TAJ45612.1 hypothetical protein CUJ86_02500 [Methanofollis fontis]